MGIDFGLPRLSSSYLTGDYIDQGRVLIQGMRLFFFFSEAADFISPVNSTTISIRDRP